MIDATTRAKLADELWAATTSRVPIAPISDRVATFDLDDAYAVQSINVERLLGAGRSRIGRKVGLTSRAMQQVLGVSEPDFGVLLDNMAVLDGSAVPMDRLLEPRIEAEIAFMIGSDLVGPGVTTEDALHAIDGAAPALEIIDSRIAEWRIKLVDTVADNASCGLIVLGAFSPIGDRDLRLVGGIVERNGVLVDHGVGAAVLGHPAACVAWLANKLADFGDGLDQGEVVLPGAVHAAVDVSAGDEFRAEFDALGAISVRFTDPGEAA